ncbi:MAG: hypothetical protein K9J74_12945 [Sulfuritalea sp.]|nr:hypothetical protein [Sulfuritalea sp.]
MCQSIPGCLLFACCFLIFPARAANCADTDKQCAKTAQREHVVNRIDFWQAALSKPIAQRFGKAQPELIDYVRLDNIANGFRERPTPALISADFRRDLEEAFAELPNPIKRALDSRLAGVYLVQGLGSTGFTDKILDANGRPVAAYVILDLDLLAQRKANAWATWKESTPFQASDTMTLAATIESPDNDSRKNAIQYILLHEFGHVLSVGRNVHPPWWLDDAAVNAPEFPFFSLSWHFSEPAGRFVTFIEDQFPLRKRVVYYADGKLGADQMVRVYSQLEASNFASLYAATNPFDDFAESFVSYVHTVLMHKPFEIRISQDGKSVKRFESCWEKPRCGEKRRVLEQFILSYQ